MQFDVRALSAANAITALVVDGYDEADARRKVEAQGLYVAAIGPVRQRIFSRRFKSRAAGFNLVLFSQELLALLNAGLSIVECLEALIEKDQGAGRSTVLVRLLESLREGKRFSNVLGEQPEVFPALYVGIIRAAEGTSDLPRALQRFIEYQQRVDVVRNKLVSAAIYPAILLMVGGAVSAFLIGYVVPRFSEVYEGGGRELPWLSQILLDWGKFAASHAKSVLLAAGVVALATIVGLRSFVAKGGIAKLVSLVPGLANRVRVYQLSRMYMTLGMLLEGGIPVVAAMETVAAILPPDTRTALARARQAVESGAPVSASFEVNGLTTPISLRMLRVGERSGELGRMLVQSSAFYDEEISRWIERFTRTFEPLLMAAIGLVIGCIVVLLYMPIFDLAGSLS